MYIRFVVGSDDEDHRQLTGVITKARLLRDDGGLEQHQITSLEEAYVWLNEHLPRPPFSTSGWGREDGSLVRGNRKLKESTLRFAWGRPQASAFVDPGGACDDRRGAAFYTHDR
jgi:hypothetical protein